MSIDVRLGTRDEEGPGLVQHIKAGKVDVATIHDVEMAPASGKMGDIEGMNVVQLAIRDVDKTRNVAPQVEQRVHLHRRLGDMRKCAHGKTRQPHRAMVVESRA